VVARLIFAALLLLLAVWIARDFLAALAWAVIITASVWPAYEWFLRKTSTAGQSTSAAALFTALVAVTIFLPFIIGLQQLADVREPALAWIKEARESGIPVPGWLGQAPVAGEYVSELWKANLGDPKAIASMLSGLDTDASGGWMQAFGGNLLHRVFLFGIALAATFFLFRDGRWIAGRVIETIEVLLGTAGRDLATKTLTAMRGIVNGTILVALAEGVAIGIGYFFAGVPKPFVFTLLTASFAMLPFGAWVAFSAAALLLLAEGQSSAGAAVFGWGAIIMILGDHFLWPAVVGGAARLPFVLALIGIFGGLQAFGLVGLFAGPIVMAAAYTVWREWLGAHVKTS
jgi:predicted PurR-regulated permease PerM